MATRLWSIGIGLLLAGPLVLTACGGKSGQSTPSDTAKQWFRADPGTAGVIEGRVLFGGRRPAPRRVEMDGDPQCAELHKSPLVDEAVAIGGSPGNETLGNVFVYIKTGLEGKSFEPPADPVVIEQRGCWFGPRVQGIMVGQTLKVINADPLTHNIHPLPEINRDWNQSQAPGDPPLTRRFSQPEVMIRVKCNIHRWMHAWVGAVAHPYFAVTGKDGGFRLEQVPPGSYTIEAWHEELGRQESQVTLSASGKSEFTFRFNSKQIRSGE